MGKKPAHCFRSDNNLLHLHIHLLCLLSQCLNLWVPVARRKWTCLGFLSCPLHSHTRFLLLFPLPLLLILLLNCNPVFLHLWCNYATSIALTWEQWRGGGTQSLPFVYQENKGLKLPQSSALSAGFCPSGVQTCSWAHAHKRGSAETGQDKSRQFLLSITR